MMNRRTFIAAGVSAGVMRIPGVAFAADDYATVSYPSGELKIAAYLYQPPGAGPFPLIVFNHGSRKGADDGPGDLLRDLLHRV